MRRKLNLSILVIVPIGCGTALGWLLVFTAFQTVTLGLSLLLFVHWVAASIGHEGVPLLDRPLVGAVLSVGLLACVWLSFFRNPTGGVNFTPALGQEVVRFPRPIGVIVTCLPAAPYLVYILGEMVWGRREQRN